VSQDVLDTIIGGITDPEAAQRHYEDGLAADTAGDRISAIGHFRKATHLDNSNVQYLFRLAYALDLVGEEDEAIALYEQACSGPQPHVNALLNLAVVYEDRNDIAAAERCLKQVLETNPNHPRALLFMKDVCGSRDMYYDEEVARDMAKHSVLLDTPVTDFELSVRARNCLKKMQIRTLGDLLRITEAELLSYKNFGETSLVEIKAMLAAKSLRLGQGADGEFSRARREVYEELRDKASDAVLNKPVSALDLSVRARKALQMLGIQSIGDLATRTEAELMGVKNFGQTSLDEIHEKLTKFGLGLRVLDDDED